MAEVLRPSKAADGLPRCHVDRDPYGLGRPWKAVTQGVTSRLGRFCGLQRLAPFRSELCLWIAVISPFDRCSLKRSTPMSKYQTRFLRGLSEVQSLADQWNDLWHRSDARQPTAMWEGLVTWVDSFGSPDRTSAIVVELDGRLVVRCHSSSPMRPG